MRPEKWLWILTLVNIAIVSLLVLAILATLFVLREFAAYVSAWPVAALLFLGAALSLIVILIGKRTTSRVPRIASFAINGSILALHSIIILGMIAVSIGVEREKFIMPEGYQGDVYVIHSVENGEPEKRAFRQVIYRIPLDGILRTQVPLKHGWTWPTYYYEHPDGTQERILNDWPTTVHRTPENLKNYKDFGVFFPRTGSMHNSFAKCSVEFEQFYVGTKAYLLSGFQQKDFRLYLQEHPVDCSERSAVNSR